MCECDHVVRRVEDLVIEGGKCDRWRLEVVWCARIGKTRTAMDAKRG